MDTIIYTIIEFLSLYIFIGFGFYSMLYFIFLACFKPKKAYCEFDNTATRLMAFAGMLYGVLFLIEIMYTWVNLPIGEDKIRFITRLIGAYWFGFWLPPIFLMVLSQLLRINTLKKNRWFRIFLSLFFVISFDKLLIIISSFHRDYLPTSWNINLGSLCFGIFFKGILFFGLVLLVHHVKRLIKLKIKMKTIKPITRITLIFPLALFLVKLYIDLETIVSINQMNLAEGDIQPSLVVGSLKTMSLLLVIILLPFILSIVAFKRKYTYSKRLLLVNSLVFVYMFIPVGLFILFIKLSLS